MADYYEDPNEPLLPGENPDLKAEIISTIGEDWLNAANQWFGGRKPVELLGTNQEFKLRNLVRLIMVAGIS